MRLNGFEFGCSFNSGRTLLRCFGFSAQLSKPVLVGQYNGAVFVLSGRFTGSGDGSGSNLWGNDIAFLLEFFDGFALLSFKVSFDVFFWCNRLVHGRSGSSRVLSFAFVSAAAMLL